MRASLILPTYEEEGHIHALLEAIEQALQSSPILEAYEIIVVDDSPTDGTAKAVEAYISRQQQSAVRLHRRQQSDGLADAIHAGIQQAEYEFFIIMDSDFNHHPRYLPIFVALAPHYDLVIGSRYIVGGAMRTGLIRYAGSFLFNMLVRFVLRTRIHDNLSGFLGIRRSLYERLNHSAIFVGYGDYFIRLIFNARFFKPRIVELPVIYEQRPSGDSKTSLLKVLVGYTICVLQTFFFFPRNR